MRKLGSLLVVLGLLLVPAATAGAEAPSTDRQSAANFAARWVGDQVNGDGAIESAPGTPSPGLTAQGLLALVAASVGPNQVDAMIGYLEQGVDAQVQDSGGVDQPGPLAFLILDAVATGEDPHAFGDGGDLVARLDATQQPDGLYGAQDPSFDGAFRQGLALTALGAVATDDPEGVQWMLDQQCDDGGWTAFRTDTSAPCPPVDPATFTGEDTNSTALAVIGLAAQDAVPSTPDPAAFLDSVRTDDGGWSYLADADGQSDADSTGLVVQALLAEADGGTPDAQGIGVLRSLQIGCDAPAEDRGALAFQADPGGGSLTPNGLATIQALPALAGAFFPLAPRSLAALPAAPNCDAAPATTTTTAALAAVTTTTAPAAAATVRAGSGTLPATGAGAAGLSSRRIARIGLALVMAGISLMILKRRRPDWW
ncbi:MAG: hypothetical protein QOE35_4051 [Actinomycetota bacterium]|jgi:hypothetical protein